MKNNFKLMAGLLGFCTRRRLFTFLFSAAFILVFISGCDNKEAINASDVILLVNSNTAEKSAAMEKVIPYLNNFGVKFTTVDLATEEILSETNDPALVIIGHSGIATGLTMSLEDYLNQCQSKGTGILSFDPLMPANLLTPITESLEKDPDVGTLRFSDETHYITGYRSPGETKELFGYMSIPKMSVKEGEAIITGNDLPLLVAVSSPKGRIAQWTSQDWMYYSILGPLGGLDDCLWKSIVWAARKPFVMQALPPLTTMRVDDVVGSGRQQWDVSPFQWVKTVNKYGFKPWMGLFIYNITPEGVNELKELLPAGLATGTPHAFGRPPRKESEIETIVSVFKPYYAHQMAKSHFVPEYWYPNAIPYLSEYYDEFIYFDHNNQKPYSPEISQKILKSVDDWYKETALPMGKYLVPHWGEINADMISHIQDQWGIDFVGIREVDKSWEQQTPEYSLKKGEQPIRTAPFRLSEEPEVGKEKENAMTSRAAYNAGFRNLAGRELFDFSSSINDITGYEWQPDNNVEATAERGVKIISRGIEAKALAVLFTHETDYIYKIEPENWDQIFNIISGKISVYNPVLLTTDEALKILRAFQTSEIQNAVYDQKSGKVSLQMKGKTDVPTSVFVYTDQDETVREELIEIPVFQNELSKGFVLSN